MTERKIQYVPISKLSRGYAGKMIDHMYEEESVIYIMRNNEPTAVMLSIVDYNDFLSAMNASKRINKKEVSARLSGSLHQYADVSKIAGEREHFRKEMIKRHE